MRSQLLLFPAALVCGIAGPAQARIYMDVAEAQRLMFPGASFTERFHTLSQDEYNAVIEDSEVQVHSRNIRAWKASTGGWFILDQVRGKDDWITYAVAIGPDGGVRQIEILECLDNYDGITMPAWRGQFYGRARGSGFEDIEMISGATLSSGQMIAGIKRVLSTVALVLEPV